MALRIPGLGNANLRRGRDTRERFTDLGFGTKYTGDGQRLINKDGSFNVKRIGRGSWTVYQDLVEMSWTRFIGIIVLFFFLINSLFASLYVSIGLDSLSGVVPKGIMEDFSHAFFFSVQTFTTVGYGSISPSGFLVNIVAALDALVGLIAFALATGLFFARFSKPKAQILFSEKAIIAPYQGGTGFEFRIANLRNNRLIDLKATVIMSWLEDVDGNMKRKFTPLPLERDKVTLFPLNWTIVHPIDEKSPFYKKTETDVDEMKAEILVMLQGYDETYAQNVHVNRSYTFFEIEWNVSFDPMYHYDDEDSITILELDKIDSTTKAKVVPVISK